MSARACYGRRVIDARILVLYTGGTIGMREGPRGYEPARGALSEVIERLPQLHEVGAARFTTPRYRGGRRIHHEVLEYEPLLDSANLELSHWARFAKDIAAHHDNYDGFVILHGTDTMAYTASALSFLLENLGKPVVLTGSQIPLVQLTRNDALDNFLGALGLAAHLAVPEVTLYFHHRLLRGNRSSKHDASSLDAFASPNFPPLAEVGVDVEVRRDLVLPAPSGPFRAHTTLSPHVAALRLYPGITAETLANFVRPPLEGLVLETYGSGNAPDSRRDLLEVLAAACARGLVILNVSQCPRGGVNDAYAAGRALATCGVVPGADMTPEAALTKLAFLLGQGHPVEEVKRLVRIPLRGELTPT
jgi:60kDa lysophospholipase